MAKLRELLDKGLFVNNLLDMHKECCRAMEQSKEPLAFYVLASIFYDIWALWREEAIFASQVKTTEECLLPPIKDVLDGIGTDKVTDTLNNLVKQYLIANKEILPPRL